METGKCIAKTFALLAFAMVASGGSAVAQSSTPAPADAAAPSVAKDPSIEELLVLGRKRETERVTPLDNFTVATPNGGLAIWRRSLCVSVRGVVDENVKTLVDRMSVIASQVQLNVDNANAGECRGPNVSIVFGEGLGEALLQPEMRNEINVRWKKKDIDFTTNETKLDARLGKAYSLTDEEYELWASSSAPIKYWHYTEPYDVTEGPITTRIRGNETESFSHALVFAEINRIDSYSLENVADHIGFVVLTGVNPYPTSDTRSEILNLFAQAPGSIAGLGDFDHDYLAVYYSLDHFRRSDIYLKKVDITQALCERHGHCWADDMP